MSKQPPILQYPNPRSPIPNHPSTIIIAGNVQPSGAYILRIRLQVACDVSFGRFRRGEPVGLPAGDYAYIGSAMGKRGSSTLANRLLRHARRADTDFPQAIYAELEARFSDIGWTEPPVPSAPANKTLRWHIDYLLERPESSLAQIYVVCCPDPIESAIAKELLADPMTNIVVPGIGASDDRGSTHLLLVDADGQWWRGLPQRMNAWSF